MAVTRRTFLGSAGSLAAVTVADGRVRAEGTADVLAADATARQREAAALSAEAFATFRDRGLALTEAEKADWYGKYPILRRYDAAYEKVFREAAETKVTGPTPAVWYVYNMGIVIKTRETLFSVDLAHRQDVSSVPLVDFACYTHNHEGHRSESCIDALNAARKLIISNFDSNGGAKATHNGYGGYVRRPRTFCLKDVRIETHVAAHDSYLLDFTMPVEIAVGDYRIYHSGDLLYHYEILLNRPRPDLWIANPCGGMKIEDGVQMVRPKRAVICHLQELGHAPEKRRTFEEGLKAVADCRGQGHEAVVPMWGERIA